MTLFELTVVMTPLFGLMAGLHCPCGQSVAASVASGTLGAVIGLLIYPVPLMLLSKVERRINLGQKVSDSRREVVVGFSFLVYAMVAPLLAYAMVSQILPPLMRVVR